MSNKLNAVQKSALGWAGSHLVGVGTRILNISQRLAAVDNPCKLDAEMRRKNMLLRGKGAGRRCFVIGTGPSLSSQDLAPLRDDITIVVSGFWKHKVISHSWQPTYYCIADPLFFDETHGADASQSFFHSLNDHVKKAVMVLPYQAKSIVEAHGLNGTNDTVYVEFRDSLSACHARDINLSAPIPGVQSVSQLGVEVALHLRCNPIYLIGCDHDWLAHRGDDRHFYSGLALKHSAIKESLSQFYYKDILRECLALWEGYEALGRIAAELNIQIFNATAGGFLDVFPRVTYERLFEMK